MEIKLVLLLFLIILVHIGIVAFSWTANRYFPLINKFLHMESESLQLHTIAKSYDRLIEVPQDLLLPPEPTIIKEAKKIELRLMLEASLIILSGIIPPGLVALYFNF